MPATYQAPTRDPKPNDGSKSQTVTLSDKNATVADVLNSKTSEVFSIGPEDTLLAAVNALKDRRIGALMVTDSAGGLVGILSERDIVRKLADTPGQTLPQTVESVMTHAVQTCAPSDSIVSVLKRMTAGRYRHMPVVDGSKLVGMVTIGDAITHRLNQLEHEALQLKQLIVG